MVKWSSGLNHTQIIIINHIKVRDDVQKNNYRLYGQHML